MCSTPHSTRRLREAWSSSVSAAPSTLPAWLLVPPHQPLLGRGRGRGSSEAESGMSVQKVGNLGASAKGRPRVRQANSSIK